MNYQKELEKLLEQLTDKKAGRLLLHSCCAPCSSYVLEYLKEYFKITVFYYNPNITQTEEYWKRAEEQKRLISRMNEAQNAAGHTIEWIESRYEPIRFLEAVKGLESCAEGGERCEKCFRLRLEETAAAAKKLEMDYFTTTLSISPLKNAVLLNRIGMEMGRKYGVNWLPSDFKKKNGYKRSVELSAEYGLYRQNYCGCIYSKRE